MLTQPTEEAIPILGQLPVTKVTKGKRLVREGLISDKVFIIKKGVFRRYYYEDGHEINHQFFSEGDIVLSVRGLYLGLASKFIVEAIESGEVQMLEMDKYIQQEDNEILKKVFCRYLLQIETLELIHSTKSVDVKYELFLKAYPKLINRIPLKWVASILQIHPTTLSKIRRRNMKA